MRRLLLSVLLFSSSLSYAQSGGKFFGEFRSDTGALISFTLKRKNIAGIDFDLVLPGLCLYDDGAIEENTFTLGGEDFPDLLLKNSRVQVEFPVTANSFHVGTLTLDLRAIRDSEGKIKKFRGTADFYSPARPEIQLDHCSAGASFNRIRPAISP